MADLKRRRRISERQARNCENALTPRCRCRCGGLLHGIGRIAKNAPRVAYEALPEDDPHYLPPKKTERDSEIDEAQEFTVQLSLWGDGIGERILEVRKKRLELELT